MILGYCRVSSDEQAAHGISVDAQRDILTGFAAMSQDEIRIYEDAGFSGKNTQRPALQQLLATVRSGSASAVVVWKLDRLSRSLRDTLAMIEDVFQPHGVRLVSVTESIDTSTPSGRMMLNLLASFAQLEREQDSDRVVMSHKHLARDCKYLGGHVPLGYCIDENKHYQLDPVAAPVVRRVFDLYLSRAGYAEILRFMNDPQLLLAVHRTRPWTKAHLNFLLGNEIYAGIYVRRMGADKRHRITAPEIIRIPGGVPAVLSPEEWQRVCEIRCARSASHSGPVARTVIYPLSGLVYCGVCGKMMYLNHGGKDRAGNIERYYTCKQKCVRPARLEKVQDAVFSSIAYLCSDPNVIARACAIANTFTENAEQENQAAIRPAEERLQEIRRQISRLVTFIKNNDNVSPSLMTELETLEREASVISSRIETLRHPRGRYNAAQMEQLLRAAANIKEMPPAQQRERLQAAVHRVQVFDKTYRILLAWQPVGGDEPPVYACHDIPR